MSILDIFKIKSFKKNISKLEIANLELSQKLKELDANSYFEVQEKIENLNNELEKLESHFNEEAIKNNTLIDKLHGEVTALTDTNEKLSKQVNSQTKKLIRVKSLYKSVEYAIDNFMSLDIDYSKCKIPTNDLEEYELISPTIFLKLHCMDMKDLRKSYKENEKQINQLLELYSARYTTKANKSIYNLMVIALRAELQNILYNLKYEKLDISIEAVKKVSAKYLIIAGEGNQSIAGTLTKFIGEIEYLFINAIKIEYNYYVKKEQAKQEQLAIREQMRQEAEERKALELERKKIEKEESKYTSEIAKLTEMLSSAIDEEAEGIKLRITELQDQLTSVIIKKEDIINLQNGKAGNVYIISNLGSFGENIFKIGMTRRLDPIDRVNELGSASVPFKFDVHSFIFSDDAVGLESKLHELLNTNRVNKVNPRKEFFNITIDELETIVNDIAPTAEFNHTMIAEEYRQSCSTNEAYSNNYKAYLDEDSDEDVDEDNE